MALRTFIAALSISTLIHVCPAVAQTTAEAKGYFSPQQKAYRESVQQHPLIKQHKIEQVLHIRVDDSQLAVEPIIEPDREYMQRRAELEGVPEPVVIVCWLLSVDLGQVQFEVRTEDYSDPTTYGRLSLQARPNTNDTGKLLECLDIEKIWQTPTGSRRVFFTQANSTVRLIFADEGGANTVLVEKDFITLRRNHHADTERWLRPILRELHQESAFAADPAAAWQVLAEQWPVDEKMLAVVAEQVPALDDNDFRVRLHAANALQKLGRDAALAMLRMDRRRLSVEQNLRLDEVVARFQPLAPAEARRLSYDVGFLLDCLYGDDAIARKLALQRLRTITGKPIEFDLNAPEDARVIAVNTLRDKLLGVNRRGKP